MFKNLAPNLIASGLNPLFDFGGPTLSSAAPGVYNCLKAMGNKDVGWAVGTVLIVKNANHSINQCLKANGYFNGGVSVPQTRAQFMQIYGADGYTAVVFHKANTLGLSFDYFDPESGLVFRAESSWSHNV